MTELMLAGLMPFERILEELENAIEVYKSDKTEDNKQKIAVLGLIINVNLKFEKDGGGVEAFIKNLHEFREAKQKINK